MLSYRKRSHRTRVYVPDTCRGCKDGGGRRKCAHNCKAELQTTRTVILQVQEVARDGGEGGRSRGKDQVNGEGAVRERDK